MCREIIRGLLIAEHRSSLAAVEGLFWHGGREEGAGNGSQDWIELERDGFAIDSAGSGSH